MKLFFGLFAAIFVTGFATSPVSATVLLDTGITTLNAGDPTQLGRLLRDGTTSEWAASKAFPGELNPTTAHHYRAFDIAIAGTPFVQITIDDSNSDFFASAYLNSYVSTNKSATYLGDLGFSGNAFGIPQSFQVVAPDLSHLIVVVNETNTNAGLGPNFRLVVEGFDSIPSSTPLPAAFPLMATVLGGVVFVARSRRRRVRSMGL